MNQYLDQKQNKYQDALDYVSDDWKCNLAESFDEGGIDEEEYDERLKSYDLLQELVDKATPKKIKMMRIKKYDGYNIGICSCGQTVDDSLNEGLKFCPYCGQAINWGEDDE